MPFMGANRGPALGSVRPRVIKSGEKMGLPWNAYYVLTKALASLANSKVHPNSGSPNYNVRHDHNQDFTNAGTNTHAEIDIHIADESNPHSTDYAGVSGADAATDVTAAELEELSNASDTTLHGHDVTGLTNWPTIDYAYVSGNDAGTGVTAAELEELTDASETTLHSHAASAVSLDAAYNEGATITVDDKDVVWDITNSSYRWRIKYRNADRFVVDAGGRLGIRALPVSRSAIYIVDLPSQVTSYGIECTPTFSGSATTTATAVHGRAYVSGIPDLKLIGVMGFAKTDGSRTYTKDIIGGLFQPFNTTNASATIAKSFGVKIEAPTDAVATPALVYGLYIDSMTNGATNYSIYTAGGQVKLIDDTTGITNLDVSKNVATATVPVANILQDATDGAQPCLALDQDDESEGFIDLIGSARGAITGATNSTESARIELNGTVYRIALYADA